MSTINKTKQMEKINNTSGILLDNELKIRAYTGKINKVYVVMVQCILIFCAVIFSMFSFINGMDIKVNVGIFLLIAFIAVVLNYIAFTILKYSDRGTFAIILIFTYVLYFMLETEKIGKELVTIVSRYLDYINDYFELEYLLILNVEGKEPKHFTRLFAVFMLFIIMIVSYNVIMGFHKYIYLLSTGIWPVLCLVVGKAPDGIFFIGYIGITAALFLMTVTIKTYKLEENLIKNKKGKRLFKEVVLFKTGICGIIGFLIMAIFMSVFFNKNTYESKPFFKNVSVELHAVKDNIINKIKGIEDKEDYRFNFIDLFKNRDVLGNGKISESGSVKFKNEKVFDVVSNRVTESMYLKNYIGLEYDKGWITDNLDSTDLALYNQYENQLLDVCKEMESYIIREEVAHNMICIKNLDIKGAVDLIPYAPSIDYDILKDGTVKYKNSKKEIVVTGYEIEYAKLYALIVLNDLLDTVDINNSVNMSYYLEVPNELKSAIDYIRSDFENYRNKALENSKLVEKYGEYGINLETIRALVNYLNYEYQYTLTPGKIEENLDPIEYFLKYNKKGYCMYYAAAATAILREYNIPTRYVEGYVIKDTDMGKSKSVDNLSYTSRIENLDSKHYDFSKLPIYEYGVKDKNGHAWVEVYLSGLGWVPVEVTSSRLVESEMDDTSSSDEKDNQEDDIKPSNRPVETYKPIETQKPENIDEPIPTKNISDKKEKKPNKKKSETVLSEEMYIMIYICIILCTGILGILFIKFIKLKRHVDKYKTLINVDKLAYIKESMFKIFASKEVEYKNSMKYAEFIIQISKKYPNYEKEKINNVIDILLKQQYSEDTLTKADEEKIIEFYNYAVTDYTKDMKYFKKKYECFVKNYIQKL